jgi:WD40 repeat protein
LWTVNNPQAVQAALVYRQAYHHLADPDVGTRLSYLQFAVQSNSGSPERWLSATEIDQPWKVAWANWRNEAPHWAIVVQRSSRDPQKYFASNVDHSTQHAISAVVVARLGDTQVVVSGSVDGTLHIWRLSDGALIAPAIIAHEGSVNQIAAIEIGNRLLILSAGEDGALALWDSEVAASSRKLHDHKGWPLRAVAAAKVDERWIAVFSGVDPTIRMIDVESGSLVAWERQHTKDRTICCLTIGEISGRTMVLAGDIDGLVHCWPLISQSKELSTFSDHDGSVVTVRIIFVGSEACITSVDRKGTVVVRGIGAGEPTRFHTGHNIKETFGWLVSACIAKIASQVVLAAGDYTGEIRVIDLESRSLASNPIVREIGGVTSIALPDGDDLALVSGDGEGMLRVWSVDPAPIRLTKTVGHIRSLAVGTLDGRNTAAAGTSDGLVHFFNTANGSTVRQAFSALDGYLPGLAFVDIDGWPHLATSGFSDRFIRIWDLRGARQVQKQALGPFAGGFTVQHVPLDANPVIAFEGLNFEINLWNLSSNALIAPTLKGHTEHIFCMRSARLNDELVLASSGADGTIRLWNIATEAAYCAPIDVGTQTAALAFGRWKDRTALFSGGLNGRISIWNPHDGQMLGSPFSAHTNGINTIILGTMDGGTTGISGGADSTLVIWRPTGEILNKIYIGAWILSIRPAEGDRIIVGTAQGALAITIPGLSFDSN